ncbi:hypothetical protein L6164_025670 [Bauhinia variegata]|uniref:Uncharacterized protein n=2 Tax=Bauhinia variegata TaxID=167791 RepID=A0ACB9M240_BAUVA|nr:hypothetical protein L6164_025670 [Bauhinia variegata]
MVLQILHQCPIASPFQKSKTPLQLPKTEPLILNLTPHLHLLRPIGITGQRRHRLVAVSNVVEESQESSEPETANSASEEQQQEPVTQSAEKGTEMSELASELKKAMQERKEKEEENLLSGVAEEIREIEWPAFGKVLGTMGVVISVILGSSVVLTAVNAVLAELSDKVFAGKGVQDFFS